MQNNAVNSCANHQEQTEEQSLEVDHVDWPLKHFMD